MQASLNLELTQCTGVSNVGRLSGTGSPRDKASADPLVPSLEGSQAAQSGDQRQPLHEHNSQTPSSSQRRSPNASDSIVVTPPEKRQTVIVLSPERQLPPGDRYGTLEKQRALSLSPQSRSGLRRQHDKPPSLDSSHNFSLTSSLAKLQESLSQQRNNTQNASQHDSKSKQAPEQLLIIRPMLLDDTQIMDIPPTQLDCAQATALDLLEFEATQLMPLGAASPSPQHVKPSAVTNTAIVDDLVGSTAIVLLPQTKQASLSDTPTLLQGPQPQRVPRVGNTHHQSSTALVSAGTVPAEIHGTFQHDGTRQTAAADQQRPAVHHGVEHASTGQQAAAAAVLKQSSTSLVGGLPGEQQISSEPALQTELVPRALVQHTAVATAVNNVGVTADVATSGVRRADGTSQHVGLSAAETDLQNSETCSQVHPC